ncbi:MAG: DUF1572 domain-containing protein [Saprospiraceae bacterium]
MNLPAQLAKQFREVHLNGDWVAATNIKAELSDLTWKQATTKVSSLNTIAALAFHINYYVAGILNVLEGGSLDIRDKYSFDLPLIESQSDWEKLLNKMWSDAEKFANLVEQMTGEKLREDFSGEKYGTYHRNILGMIEHCYYHLGQIVLIKKLLLQADENMKDTR